MMLRVPAGGRRTGLHTTERPVASVIRGAVGYQMHYLHAIRIGAAGGYPAYQCCRFHRRSPWDYAPLNEDPAGLLADSSRNLAMARDSLTQASKQLRCMGRGT